MNDDGDEDPRGRLERALDLAPAAAPEVEGLGLQERDAFAHAATLAARLPDVVAQALAALPDHERQDLLDRRFVVAGLDLDCLGQLDGTLLDSANAGILGEAGAFFGALLQTLWPAPAVEMLEGWFSDQMRPGLDDPCVK